MIMGIPARATESELTWEEKEGQAPIQLKLCLLPPVPTITISLMALTHQLASKIPFEATNLTKFQFHQFYS